MPILATAQTAARITVADDSSYTAADTTVWVNIHARRNYTATFHALDSCNVTITAQYRGGGVVATVFQSYNLEADSTNSTADAGFWKGFVLRGPTADNIPGAERIRFIVTPKTTRNGTSSATYDIILLSD